jgi:transcription elongation factor Elf1
MKTYRVDLKETIYYPTQIVEADTSEKAEARVKEDGENGALTCGDCDLDFQTEEK